MLTEGPQQHLHLEPGYGPPSPPGEALVKTHVLSGRSRCPRASFPRPCTRCPGASWTAAGDRLRPGSHRGSYVALDG
jgi:hypothetical protein